MQIISSPADTIQAESSSDPIKANKIGRRTIINCVRASISTLTCTNVNVEQYLAPEWMPPKTRKLFGVQYHSGCGAYTLKWKAMYLCLTISWTGMHLIAIRYQ